jgi:ectoine hydroxylase-related dioxygenase (phytanoyl-CoA dioxygenase family)
MLNREQQLTFARTGYLVVPQVVPPPAIAAARQEIERRLSERPPPAGHRGPHMLFLTGSLPAPLSSLLFETPALRAAEALIAPGKFETPDHLQLSLNFPPFPHRPGGPHMDGLSPPEPDGRPGTFTLLAGIFLTDQSQEESGNLWVWPGSHRAAAAYFRAHGPEAVLPSAPYPPVALPEPRQVTGRAGDLLLAHYMLGHNIGGNTSRDVREAVYFRLSREGHRDRWRDCVQDPLLEFEPARAAVDQAGHANLP